MCWARPVNGWRRTIWRTGASASSTAIGAVPAGRLTLWRWTATELVIVEVKTRRSRRYGDPLEALTRAKLLRLRTLAVLWAREHQHVIGAVRIDAVGIVMDSSRVAQHRPSQGCGLMGMGRALAVALVGLNGHVIEVEADIGQTLPNFVLLGLPDASLSEARERIRSAAQNSGIPLSRRKITVNLVPASLPKKGSGFDLAIVMAALDAAGDVRGTGGTVFIAELGLDGRLRPVRGVLPAVLAALSAGYTRVCGRRGQPCRGPAGQGGQGARLRLPGPGGRGLWRRSQGPGDLDGRGRAAQRPWTAPGEPADPGRRRADLSEVAGQPVARLALEIAAAGGHHLMMVGPPGSGKTMLAERLPGLLPDLNDAEAMEVTAIHSLEHRRNALAAAAPPPTLRAPAPFGQHGSHHWRRQRRPAARGRIPGPPGRTVPGRGPRVRQAGPGRPAAAAGKRGAGAAPFSRHGGLPGPLPAGHGRQPLPLRQGHRARGSTANAPPWPAGATSAGSRARCWTGWTSSCRSTRSSWPSWRMPDRGNPAPQVAARVQHGPRHGRGAAQDRGG